MKEQKQIRHADQQQDQSEPATRDMSKYFWFFIAINIIMALVAVYKIMGG